MKESHWLSRSHYFAGLVFFLFLASIGKISYAHSLGQSYIFLKIYDDKVTGRFEITVADLNKALETGKAGDPVTGADLTGRMSDVHAYYLEKVNFSDQTGTMSLQFTGQEVKIIGQTQYVLLDFLLFEDRPTPESINVGYSVLFDVVPDHEALLVVEQHWRANIFDRERNVVLSFDKDHQRGKLEIENYSIFHGFFGIVKKGIKHIWMGIDHILFLVALILPAAMIRKENSWQPVQRFRPAFIYVVKIVTLFTIAHSLTLSLAAMNIIDLPSRLVESVIALSIVIAALDILFPVFHGRIGWVVFIFGLFHGFGFASVLSHLGVLGEHMALSLFGFNVGVEIGQVVVICFLFPVLYVVRNYAFYPKAVMKAGALALIVVGMYWFGNRALFDGALL